MKVNKQKVNKQEVKKKCISDFNVGSQILSEINFENHKTAIIEMEIFKDNGKRYDYWSGKKKQQNQPNKA